MRQKIFSCQKKQLNSHHYFLYFLFMALTLSTPLSAAAVLYAQDINYGGNAADLQSTPSWYAPMADCLFPGSVGSPLSSDNRITINYASSDPSSTNPGSVFGGLSQTEDATNNSVELIDGHVVYNLVGGESINGGASGNTVTISGGSIGGYIYGGGANANAANNTVTISGGSVGKEVYGGNIAYLGNGDAIGNSVTVSGGSLGRDVFGGFIDRGGDDADAIGNNVTISGGSVGWNAYGGFIYNSGGDTIGNSVTVSGGGISGSVAGGFSYTGASTGNTVNISDGAVRQGVRGGYIVSGDSNVTGNYVTVSGGAVGGSIYGGEGQSGSTTDNVVTVSGGSIDGYVYGGFSNAGVAAGNRINISGGTIGLDVYGGYINSGVGNATDNVVTVSGGSIDGYVYGGFGYGSVIGNTVTINDGLVRTVSGGFSIFGNTTDNMITISGGTVNGDIYGGEGVNGSATYNTVTISGAPDLSSSYIRGGWSGLGSAFAFIGNTFNLKSSNMSVAGIASFENYNFYLPAGTADGDIMLSSASAVDVDNTNVSIFLYGGIAMQTGDKVSLINSAAGVSGLTMNNSYQASLGTFLTYDFSIYTDSYNLWAELASITGTLNAPATKAITNSRLAPLAFINQGADLVAAIDDFVISRDKTDSRYTAFAAVNGGSSTYDTGSDIDIDGVSFIAGVMWDTTAGKNDLLLSAFVEAGWGDYDTNNSFGDSPPIDSYSSGGSPVRGSGDMNYYGGGLWARYQLTRNTQGGLYADASLRVGKINTDFSSKDALDSAGTKAGYDSDSTYYGAHLGLGYIWRINDKTNIDISSKYLWTRLGGDEFVTTAGDRIEFDDADSHRWRTGFRVNHVRNERVMLYFGLAYEYEFDGDADGWLYGVYGLDRSSLSGGTGIGELGIRFKPSADNDRLTLQLGLQGYVGTREGVSGGLKLLYTF